MMKINLTMIAVLVLLVSCNTQDEQKTNSTTPPPPTNPTEKIVDNNPDLVQFGMKETTNPQGLKVGDPVPAVAFQTASDDQLSLADYYKEQPLVVIFYRGYWCPACSRHLSEFAERAVEIEEAGAKIIAVTPESYENADKTISETGIDFTVISDVDGSFMKAFDVQFDVTEAYQSKIEENYETSISETNANQSAVLPVPATFIVDTNGTIIYRQFNPDYTERASIDEIVSNLP